MNYKTLDDFNFYGKKVLLRSDLNSEVKNGKVIFSERIDASASTIKELQKKNARVVVLAHQGRKGDKDFISLEQHARLLKKYVAITFVDDTIGKKARDTISKMKNGEALLLENVRMLDEEMKPSVNSKMVKILAPLFDIYINDAFSVSHRAQTSIVSFPLVLPSGIGRTMGMELESLRKLNVGKNALFILGGLKMDEIFSLLGNDRNILATGAFANLVLMTRGYNLERRVGEMEKMLSTGGKIRTKLQNVVVPEDVAVEKNGKRKNILISDLHGENPLDIGDEAIMQFSKEIKNAKTIFMKGPAGQIENKKFQKGTRELLKAAAASKGFVVVGGGHLGTMIDEFRINRKKFGYISLAGGAFLDYLAGKKLPGLEALKKWRKK